ncbi:MAG: GNAT family N-acetyltransferase [Planctomycetes bacterium]|nr:GNAT family N-acetyltransferase [Planctomycetota bacterium]
MPGKKSYLRGIEKEDLPILARWINDSKVTHYMFMGSRPAVLDRLLEQWEHETKSEHDIVFTIVSRKGEKIIGSAGLYTINWISRSAEFRVIIGETLYWDKGIGVEITKLLTEYGFSKLNLNKVWLGVNASNLAAVKCYEKAGFIREGVLREEIYRNNQYYNAIRMSILRKEFYAQKGRR